MANGHCTKQQKYRARKYFLFLFLFLFIPSLKTLLHDVFLNLDFSISLKYLIITLQLLQKLLFFSLTSNTIVFKLEQRQSLENQSVTKSKHRTSQIKILCTFVLISDCYFQYSNYSTIRSCHFLRTIYYSPLASFTTSFFPCHYLFF